LGQNEDLEEKKLLGSGGYVLAKLTEQAIKFEIAVLAPTLDPKMWTFNLHKIPLWQ
jgi:hypothetical protein